MNYLQTYEELGLFEELGLLGLFHSPEKKRLKEIIKKIKSVDWTSSTLNGGYLLSKKNLKSKELESIKANITLKNNLISLQVMIKPVYPRTKLCKELFSILRARPLQFNFEDDIFRVTYDLTQDYVFTIVRNFTLDNLAAEKIEKYIEHDFEGLYKHMIQMCVVNSFVSKQNRVDIDNFFKSKMALLDDFSLLIKIADKYLVDITDKYKLTNKINLLNPKFIFKFQFNDSNILTKSTKHLIITERLVKIFSLLDRGMRRIKRMFNTAQFEVFLKDKAVFLNVRSNDPRVLAEWEDDAETFYDYLIELEDHCQNSSIRQLEKWSKEKEKLVFDGYTFQFDFQSVIAEIEEAYRLSDSMSVFKGLINDRIFKAMKLVVDLGQKAQYKRQDILYKVSVSAKAIIVTLTVN